jgi:hypothetical protein
MALYFRPTKPAYEAHARKVSVPVGQLPRWPNSPTGPVGQLLGWSTSPIGPVGLNPPCSRRSTAAPSCFRPLPRSSIDLRTLHSNPNGARPAAAAGGEVGRRAGGGRRGRRPWRRRTVHGSLRVRAQRHSSRQRRLRSGRRAAGAGAREQPSKGAIYQADCWGFSWNPQAPR